MSVRRKVFQLLICSYFDLQGEFVSMFSKYFENLTKSVYLEALTRNKSWVLCWDITSIFLQLYMIMIKVADVSNECRPSSVSELWLECLLQEYFAQVQILPLSQV